MFKDLPPDTVAFLWTFLGVGVMICLTALYCSRERPEKDRWEGFEKLDESTYLFPHGSLTQEREEYMRLYPPKKTAEELFQEAAFKGSGAMKIEVDPLPEPPKPTELVAKEIIDAFEKVFDDQEKLNNLIRANHTELTNIIRSHSDRMAKKLDRNTLVGKVAEQLKEFE